MASYTWSGTNGGTWSDVGNWAPGGIPGGADQTLIDLSGTYTVDVDVAEIGSLTLDAAGATVAPVGTVQLDGVLDVQAGTLALNFLDTIQGGTLLADGGVITYAGGTLDGVTVGGTLDLTGPLIGGSASQHLVIAGGLASAGTAPVTILDTGNASILELQDDETLHDTHIVVGNDFLYFDQVATLDPGSVLTVTSLAVLASLEAGGPNGHGTLDNKGTIDDRTGTIECQSGTIENDGSFLIGGGSGTNVIANFDNTGVTDISGVGSVASIYSLTNSGTVQVTDGGELALTNQRYSVTAPEFDNAGQIQLSAGGILSVYGTTGAVGTVSFLDGQGVLSLGVAPPYSRASNGGSFSGTLDMFQSGDVLQLSGSYTLQHAGNTLTLSQAGSVVDSFALTGQDYTDATFTLTGDTVTTDAPCFCAGTLILTDRGECAVEALEVGDFVITIENGIETVSPVRWLGRRHVVVAHHPEPEHVDPIRISRDAIAPGVPVRDLFVSPDHALFLDGMLIPARQLVNHMTITRDGGRATVSYHHVELDRHAVLLADGMSCESYLDGGNRDRFDGQGTVVPLHPLTADGARETCAPLATSAALVQPIWQRLAERAHGFGHQPPAPEFEPDLLPWLETVGGLPLLPCGDGLRFALPPGCVQVRLRSRSDRPTTLAPWSDDRRRLGIAVSAITLHQGNWRQEIPLAQLDGEAGWWPLETEGALAWCWTDGDARIDLPEPAEAIEIALHATMRAIRGTPADAPSPICARAG